MSKSIRRIIHIDEEKCTGCGECILSCAEGAIVLENGKAKVVEEMYCDGLGACLGHCPEGALSLEEREADPFDEEAALEHVRAMESGPRSCHPSRPMMLDPRPVTGGTDIASQLRNWPIQLHLIPEKAPFYDGASVLIAADCTGFVCGNVQNDFLNGRVAIIGCPKLDDTDFYIDKLTRIFKNNSIHDITLLRMEVPCCGALSKLVRQAIRMSGKDIPIREHIVARMGGGVIEA